MLTPEPPPLPRAIDDAIHDLARAAFLHGQQGDAVPRWANAEIEAGEALRAAIAAELERLRSVLAEARRLAQGARHTALIVPENTSSIDRLRALDKHLAAAIGGGGVATPHPLPTPPAVRVR